MDSVGADTRELRDLQKMLAVYSRATGKDMDKTITRQMRNLSFKLKGTIARYRLRRKKVWSDFRKRRAAGIGTFVRAGSILPFYANRIPGTTKSGAPTSTWQKLVHQELLRRAGGAGWLAKTLVASVKKRWRLGPDYVRVNSPTAGTTMLGEKDEKGGVIRLDAPGHYELQRKRNFVGQAMVRVTQDMEQYLLRTTSRTAQQLMDRYGI